MALLHRNDGVWGLLAGMTGYGGGFAEHRTPIRFRIKPKTLHSAWSLKHSASRAAPVASPVHA
jgi:hypothetical protein